MSSDGSSPSLPPPAPPSPSPPPAAPSPSRPKSGVGSAPSGPAGRRPGRPWYLVVALLGAWFFGSNAALIGWQHLSLFKTGTEQVETTNEESADDGRLQAQREKLDDAVYAARKRMLPLAAASLLLGVALWIFAVGAMAGRPGARVLLCQLVTAHAALAVLFFLLTPDVRRVEREVTREALDMAAQAALDGGPPDARTQQVLALSSQAAGAWQVVALGGDLLLHGIVLLALTRKRTRAFYGIVRG